jgi:peptidyl-prolyl cis-trans isomerase A (cyclophilin A)/peptidyl-prolyl cis-trans isomerase B (cyclophilin B)
MKKLLSTLIISALTLGLCAACGEKEPEIPESDPGEANYAVISVKDFGTITVRLHPEYAPKAVERFIANVRAGFYTGRNFHRIMADFMIQGGSYDGTGTSPVEGGGIYIESHPEARHYYGAFCLAANQAGYGSDSFYIVNSKNKNTFDELIQRMQIELDGIIENEEFYTEMYGEEVVQNAIDEVGESLADLKNTPAEIRDRYAEDGGAAFLDGNYTVFGYTVDGFDVIDALSVVGVVDNGFGEVSRPTRDVIIEWIIVKTTLE